MRTKRPLPDDMARRIARGQCSVCVELQAPEQAKNRRPLCAGHIAARRACSESHAAAASVSGGCYRCGAPAISGRKWRVCAQHRREATRRIGALRQRRWERDQCTRCNGPMEAARASRRLRLCASCQRLQTAENKARPETSARCKREWLRRRIEAGLCVRCGEPWKGSPRSCKACRDFQREKDRVRREEKVASIQASGGVA